MQIFGTLKLVGQGLWVVSVVVLLSQRLIRRD